MINEVILSNREQARELAKYEYPDDVILRSIAAESRLDVIINTIKCHPERDIQLPVPRLGYVLDDMNVYRRILKAGSKYRGYRFDLCEYVFHTPLTWWQAQEILDSDYEREYHGFLEFLLCMHDDTGRVNVEWPIPFDMLADKQPTA